jgi:hypothetical protein
MQFAVAFGSPFGGMTLVGPFADRERAIAFGNNPEGLDGGSDWWVVELHTTKEYAAWPKVADRVRR